MSHQDLEWLNAIDRDTLTSLVQSALQRDNVKVTDWRYQRVYGGVSTVGALAGVCRFTGHARDDEGLVPWSLILKFSREDQPDSQRERRAYQSGVLDHLPGGLAAPQCYAVVEQPGELYMLWLEDIQDEVERWPLERYGLAARHLGQFNGAYLSGDPLPTWPWLSQNLVRDRVTGSASAMAELPSALRHPLVRRFYPPDVVGGILELWAERDLFLAALERLPQTVSHLDATRRNLFARRDAAGQEQTVAIDWAFSGRAAVGEELAPLVMLSVGFNELDRADLPALEAVAFESYLGGLRDAGWRDDADLVRLGYAASAALSYGIIGANYAVNVLTDETKHVGTEQLFRMPVGEMADLWGAIARHVLGLADEARRLFPMTK